MKIKPAVGHRQRLRTRFIAGESTARTEAALLELLLMYALPQKDVQPLAKALLARFGSLTQVLHADLAELTQVSGIKENTAVLLKVVAQASRMLNGKLQALPENGQTALFILETITSPTVDLPLVGEFTASSARQPAVAPKPTRMATRYGSEVFSKSVLREAIDLLPGLPPTSDLEATRAYFLNHLRFSAINTRRRYVSYIMRRMFPSGTIDSALPRFAARFAGTPELRDVAFYRFMCAEPLMLRVMLEMFVPALAQGVVERADVRKYLEHVYPDAGNLKEAVGAIAETLQAAAIATVSRTQIKFFYREIPLAALAFIIHSEFPEPGMYDLGRIEQNPYVRALLWNPDRLHTALYELRNRGWLSKISMIDSVRQFTTRYTLDTLVDVLLAPVTPQLG